MLGITIDGEGEFQITTKEGVGVGGTSLKVQGCFCVDVQRFEVRICVSKQNNFPILIKFQNYILNLFLPKII